MAPPLLAGFKHLNLGRRLVLLLCTVLLLLLPSALGGDHAQECTTYKDCRDREDCFKGRCACSGLWGTYGAKCSTPSWGTYLLAVHVVVVFLLYRRAAALHWMSLRDHLAGKPEEGWAEALARCFCLKVAFNVTSLLAFLCMMGQRALFFAYCFSWLSVHKYRNRINGPTFILTRAWAGFLALSLLSFAWIWSSVAAQRNRKKRRQIRRQRPTSSEQTNSRSRSTSSGTGVSGSQNPAGYSNGPRRIECPCSSAALQLCGVCGVMQLVGWYGVTVLATAQLWLQTMSFVFIELMALFYFILGSYSVLGFRKLVKLLVMPCCCCGGGALSSAELLGILMHSPKANGGEPEQPPPTSPPDSLSNITPENSAIVVETRRIIPETSTERPTPPAVITEPTKPEGPADNKVNMFRGTTEEELVEAGLKAGGHRHKKDGSGRAHHRHRNKRRRDSTEETIRRLAEQQANLEDVSSRTLSLSWRRDHRSRSSHSHATPHTKSGKGKGFFAAEVGEADLPKTEHLPDVKVDIPLEVEAEVEADVERRLSDDMQPDLQRDPRRDRLETRQAPALEREGSSEGASSMGGGGGERPSNSNPNSNVNFNMGGGASASDNMSGAVNGNTDRPSLVGGEALGRLSPPTVAMLSLQEKVERSFREVLDVARVWIYCFAFSSAFMLIFAVTEQDPALGVLGSCCFSYSMVAELVVNLHCLRYVSRVVRPHLRICCGDYESVGEEDRRRRLLVRIMRLEKIRPHPSSEDNDAGLFKE